MNWPDRRDDCVANQCRGCMGITLGCWHSFSCVRDPAIKTHRCAAMWTPVLWALFLAVVAFFLAYTVVHPR